MADENKKSGYERPIQAKTWSYEQIDFRSPKKGELYVEADLHGNIQVLKADTDWLVSYQRPIVRMM